MWKSTKINVRPPPILTNTYLAINCRGKCCGKKAQDMFYYLHTFSINTSMPRVVK
jgi:hypothetical protein